MRVRRVAAAFICAMSIMLLYVRSAAAQSPNPCVATSHRIVNPGRDGDTVPPGFMIGIGQNRTEPCDASPNGYVIAPANLLDWTATDAPPFKFILTGYDPRASSATSFLDPGRIAWGAQPTQKDYKPAVLQLIGVPVPLDLNIGANEGRLRADLRQAAQHANPDESLCKAAAAFAFGNMADGNAFADLSVTGRRAFAAFRARPPQEAAILSCVRTQKPGGLAGTLIAPTVTDAMRQRAVGTALDRAYSVLHVLRASGWPVACPERAALGYVAVSGEDDQPHRPVNVATAEFPQYDLAVSVPRPNGRPPLVVHTRYMIAHTVVPQGAELASCASTGRTIPADRAPVLASDAEVILYIHGMDSSLEEAMDLTHALHKLGREQHRNYTVVSMDLPTSAYADNIDPESIAPLTSDGHAGGAEGLAYAPNGYAAPLVDFDENFVVSFVNTLSQSVPLDKRIRAVVGGSLGGNLAMRLGRPRPDAPWITNVVPWSPAAIWPSLADDPMKHPGLAVPWYFAGGDPAYAQETPGARRSFFFGKFDWQSKLFGVGIGGGRPQSEYWYSDVWPCKHAHMRLARIANYETYNHDFRLWHWRLGMEQLQFSQQSPKPGTSQPLYLSNTKRMLLMCGIDDTGGGLCQYTQEVAPKMVNTPGYALFLSATGHSIHNERPTFLARHIIDFVGK